VAGVGLGGGAYLWRSSQDRPQAEALSTQSGIGGPFQLVDQDGRPVDEGLLQGKWSAVFFGYTYCPDFCPATLQQLQAATAELGPRAQELQVVFVSVDPERDTPEMLKSYLDGFRFPGGVRGLTGAPEQVDAAAKAWRAFYRKNGDGDDYMVDHFTGVYLMDPQGRFSTVLTHGMTPDETARRIRAAMDA
jgi:protein SCO1/2